MIIKPLQKLGFRLDRVRVSDSLSERSIEPLSVGTHRYVPSLDFAIDDVIFIWQRMV